MSQICASSVFQSSCAPAANCGALGWFRCASVGAEGTEEHLRLVTEWASGVADPPADLIGLIRALGVVRGLGFGEASGLIDELGKPLAPQQHRVVPASVPGVVRALQLNRDGSDLKALTDTPAYDAEATVCSKDGSIIFTSTRDGDLDLYVGGYEIWQKANYLDAILTPSSPSPRYYYDIIIVL